MIGIGKNLFKANVKAGAAAPAYDADALAYFTANTAITSEADKNAINSFYLGLKSDGIYTKIKAMYLPIWGSAAACKWNLVNPVDTNAAYRLTFSTGWTFSSSGATPNGTSAYADTFLKPSTSLVSNSNHLCVYARTNQVSNAVPIGSYGDSSTINQLNISTGTGYYYYSGGLSTELYSALADSKGFFVGTTRANNDRKTFRNNTQQASLTTSVFTAYSTLNIYIGARNFIGTPSNYTTQQLSFSSIGDGLTDAEENNFYNKVQTLMTYFGINV